MSDSLRRLQLQGNFQGNWNLHHYWWECKMVQPRWKTSCQFLKQLNYCCCSVARLFPTFCDPVNCNMPGIPVLHYLPEFAQTHVHRVSDVIPPSLPLSSPSPPAFNLSLHQVTPNLTAPKINFWNSYRRGYTGTTRVVIMRNHFLKVFILVATCGIYFPDQESNPGFVHWECWVLATGPLGNAIRSSSRSLRVVFLRSICCNVTFQKF